MKKIVLVCLPVIAACTYKPRPSPPSERIITEVARFEQDQCTGVAVSRAGRVFVSFPLWHDGHRIHVAEVFPGGEFAPYPDAGWNGYREGQAAQPNQFICVQSVHVDDKDRLWVLDPASPRMAGTPGGAGGSAKLIHFDLATNLPVRTYDLASVAPTGSYLNDLRIDTDANIAFLTDSSLGGLVVLDLATGEGRTVLRGHPSTMAEPDVVLVCEGRELRMAGGPNTGAVPQVHADGIAFDARRGYLYWQALTARTLYRIRTSVLMNKSASEAQIAAAVENLGRTVATDGMEVDDVGNVYFSAFEWDAVMVRTPAGEMRTLVAGPLLAWPDSFAFGPNREIYFTCAQIHRTAWFNADGSMPKTPFRVFKTSLFAE